MSEGSQVFCIDPREHLRLRNSVSLTVFVVPLTSQRSLAEQQIRF